MFIITEFNPEGKSSVEFVGFKTMGKAMKKVLNYAKSIDNNVKKLYWSWSGTHNEVIAFIRGGMNYKDTYWVISEVVICSPRLYMVTGEGVAFEDKGNRLTSVVIGMGRSKLEAGEIIQRYAVKTMRSRFYEVESSKDIENNNIWIWEDEHGEEKFIITEV